MNGEILEQRPVSIIRFIAAIAGSNLIACVVALPFAFALDIIWGANVTGGAWAFTAPNTLLIVLQSIFTGYFAGAIARRRGMLAAAMAQFFPFIVLLAVEVAVNRSPIEPVFPQVKPAFWVWLGLLPAMVAGRAAAKPRGLTPVLMSIAGFMMLILQIGGTAFHLYAAFMAYSYAGLGAAAITLSTPGPAELWWCWKLWHEGFGLWNAYTLRFSLLMTWAALTLLMFAIAVRRPDADDNRNATVTAAGPEAG